MSTIKEARFILNGDPPSEKFDQEHAAEVKMENGSLQRPSWKSLRKYWRDAEPDWIEWACIDAHEELVLFSLAVAEGQGGVIAIWDTGRSQWKHVSSANFIYCAMIVGEIEAILTFHYCYWYGMPGHHRIFATPLNGTLDGSADISASVPFQELQSNPPKSGSQKPTSFAPSREGAIQSALRFHSSTTGEFVSDELGPVGLFRLQGGERFLAHDHGNLIGFTLTDVDTALEELRRE